MRIEKDYVIAFGAAVLMLAVFALAVLLPLHSRRAGYEDRIAAAQHELGIDLKEASGLAKLNKEVLELRQVVRGAQQYVPEEDELADVLRGLSEALTTHGIIEREMQTRPTQDFADYSVIPIQLQFSADYPSVHGVLQRIEQMRRLIRIDEMKVSTGRDNDTSQPLSVDLSLSTFIVHTGDGGAG